MAISYALPTHWISYNASAVFKELVSARAAVLSLTTTPFQRDWVEKLQKIQLKMEVAGTSRIEGADFTEAELDVALKSTTKPQDLLTHSQRQAHAAVETYRWIAALPPDQPIDGNLIREVHSRIVAGCDDDHCPPGELRRPDVNVTFGKPRHRGCEGGEACAAAFDRLVHAVQHEFQGHDPLIQALALHCHLAAMHPFEDGNGRTARALEALALQRAGLRDTAFIAMSNYYYDEKAKYLEALSAVRSRDYDLTPFLTFGLRGIALQCQRLFAEVRRNLAKALFQNTMVHLYSKLKTAKKRMIGDRQIGILKILLDVEGEIAGPALRERISPMYARLKSPEKAMVRDIMGLQALGAARISSQGITVNLDWPSQITESKFFERIKNMPRGRTLRFLP